MDKALLHQAWESALRPTPCLLVINKLRKIFARELILHWSPEQTSGRLTIQYPDNESIRVSHETTGASRRWWEIGGWFSSH
jgi:hypothetical protein